MSIFPHDSHMHTPLCNHAVGEPAEYAAAAIDIGLKGITFTCHAPAPAGWDPGHRMAIDQLPVYVGLVREVQALFASRLDIRLGLEVDYAPGMEEWIRNLKSAYEFDYLLGSIHPQVPEYRAAFWRGEIDAFQRLYFNHLVSAAESGLFNCLSHPDLVKNVSPSEWDFSRIADHIEACVKKIARTGVAMELNMSGLRKEIPEPNPSAEMLMMMRRADVPVVIGSDAHRPSQIAFHFDDAVKLLQQAGYGEVLVFRNGQPSRVALADAGVER